MPRMPVALEGDAAEFWLSGSEDTGMLTATLQTYEAGRMTAWPVSRTVGSPANDQAGLIDRLNSQ